MVTQNQWIVLIQYGARVTAWGPFGSYAETHKAYILARSQGFSRTTMLALENPPTANDNAPQS